MPDKQNNPEYEWIHIEDFSPGIISQSNFAYGSSDNASPVPSTLGAAQIPGTYGCMALPSGGLGPFIGYTGTSYPAPSSIVGSSGNNYITGLIVIPGVAGGDSLIYCIDNPVSTTRTLNVIDYNTAGAWNRSIYNVSATITSTASTFAFTGGLTTLLVSNTTSPGVPAGAVYGVLAFTAFAETSDSTYGGGSIPFFGIYPDPQATSTSAFPRNYTIYLPPSETAKAQWSGWMFTHAGRIAFAQAAEYYWTSTTKFLSASFDQFYFTDPPNSTPDYANDNGTNSLLQDIVYVPETPFGTGSIGSIAAGELFCVKHQKGGYIVSGDPTSPTVTWLGGVQPTYGADCVAAASPIGLIYMSAKNGAWLWNGGSQSIKVSTQLNDDFWTGAPQPPSIGPAFSLAVLGDLVFFPNNYVYNTTSNSWWIMDNQAIQYCWYGVGSDGDTVYCSPSIVPYAGGTTANQIFAYKYQLTTPATTYQWKSYPLPPTVEPEYSVTIREVVIRAQGIGTITPTFTSNNGLTGAGGTTASTTPASITLSSLTTPVRTVLTTGLINANDVCIAITSTGTGGNPAPVIYSIDIAYEKQNRLNAT